MIDFSNAKIEQLIIHLVGNQSKDEELNLSSQLSRLNDDTTRQYLMQYFVSSFKFDLSYSFTHDTDINMNEIYSYSSQIFSERENFIQQSINIAKHLYTVSTHPNIKKGELCIAYLSNCIVDEKKIDAIGIFKSENKDFYLDIVNRHHNFDIYCSKGINTNKLDKGCLIFNNFQTNSKSVFIVDSNNTDTVYWKDQFLKVIENNNAFTNTTKALKICKQFVKTAFDGTHTEKVSAINNSLNYFQTHDEFNLDDFSQKVFNNSEYLDKFKTYVNEHCLYENKFDSFTISSKAVTDVQRNIKNLIKLDANVEIKISPQTQHIEDIVEKGYDDEKCMYYYKIYYKSEK